VYINASGILIVFHKRPSSMIHVILKLTIDRLKYFILSILIYFIFAMFHIILTSSDVLDVLVFIQIVKCLLFIHYSVIVFDNVQYFITLHVFN